MRSILAAGLLIATGASGVGAADDPLVGKWRIERVRGAASVDAARTATTTTSGIDQRNFT